MKKLLQLYRKHEEIINYLIIGGLTTVVSLASYYACVLTVFDPENAVLLQAANVIAWVLSVTFAFFTNRRFVFKSKDPHILRESARFYGARVLTLLLDMLFMYVTVTVLGGNDKLMKIGSNVIIVILNYIFGKFLVFTGSKKDDEEKDARP